MGDFVLALVLEDKTFCFLKRLRCVHVRIEELVGFLSHHCVLEVAKHLPCVRVPEQKLGMLLAARFINKLREHLYQALAAGLQGLSARFELCFVLVQNLLSVDKVFDPCATSHLL